MLVENVKTWFKVSKKLPIVAGSAPGQCEAGGESSTEFSPERLVEQAPPTDPKNRKNLEILIFSQDNLKNLHQLLRRLLITVQIPQNSKSRT